MHWVEIDSVDWESAKEAYADRVIAKIADYAAGINDFDIRPRGTVTARPRTKQPEPGRWRQLGWRAHPAAEFSCSDLSLAGHVIGLQSTSSTWSAPAPGQEPGLVQAQDGCLGRC